MKLKSLLAGALLLAALIFPSALPSMAVAQSLVNPTPATRSAYSSDKAAIAALRATIIDQFAPSTSWNYAAASGGITDTTPVTIKTAAGTGKKIYIGHLSISNSGAAGTEVILRCGSGGTVMYRGWIGATANPANIPFRTPLQCTANTLVEVVLSSGTTVAVRVNAQGWTD